MSALALEPITFQRSGRTRLRVRGQLTRAHARELAAWFERRPEVSRVRPRTGSAAIDVEYRDPDGRGERLVRAARDRAYALTRPRLAERGPAVEPTGTTERGPWIALVFDAATLLAAHREVVPSPVVSSAVAIGALPTLGRTLRAVRERRLTVDMLDLLAIGASVATGCVTTAALIDLLLAVGDFVLHLTKRRAHLALEGAMSFDAPRAWRLRPDGQIECVPAKSLSAGDLVVCDLGARVPADGVVVEGVASLDTKALTGEFAPRTSAEGDGVMASTTVVEGSVVVEVERVGRDTTAGRIRQILEGAGEKPTTLQRETERIADRLVLPTLGLAGASALLSGELGRMISILITDFGTGIRISVPTSALATMTLATRNGILVKGGQFLERLARADTIAFDKTGTLTCGSPEIVDVVAIGGADPLRAIALAAAIETRQHHPVAEALRAHVRARTIDVPSAEIRDQSVTVGRGVVGRCGVHRVAVGGPRLMASEGIETGEARATLRRHERASVSSLCIAIDGRIAAVLGYTDRVRPESHRIVRRLQANGRRRIVLMSGDASGPAEEIGRVLGVDEVYSELLPHEKADRVRELQRAGRTVAMVGDGINDAPALALADVGVSLTGATDVALDTADVVLLGGDLSKLPETFRIADEAMHTIRVGLGIVIAPNALAIVLGALGAIGPSVATVLNNGSTVAAALAALAPVMQRPRTTRPPVVRRDNVSRR